MPLPTTETLPEGETIDALPLLDAATVMLDGQQAAIAAVRKAAADIARGAGVMATTIRSGKSIHYAAAGSSGLMALADACELPGTFGIPAQSIHVHMAGGVPADGNMPGDTEDDVGAGEQVGQKITEGDAVIVLTASGTTPYALDIAGRAKAKGATVIGLANNPGTPLLQMSDVPICLETPPEVIAGSTRLGAGTAQKAALNLMSSLMGIDLGHVYQGMMVNVFADNAKLVTRAARIVAQIAGVPVTDAQRALSQTDGNAKSAILVAAGCTPAQARALLATHNGHLGPSIRTLTPNQNTHA